MCDQNLRHSGNRRLVPDTKRFEWEIEPGDDATVGLGDFRRIRTLPRP